MYLCDANFDEITLVYCHFNETQFVGKIDLTETSIAQLYFHNHLDSLS